MNKLISRLIKCGMTREVALFMYRRYPDKHQFELYVESIEAQEREDYYV